MSGRTLTGTPDAGSVDSLAELAASSGRAGDRRERQAGVVRRAHGELGGQGRTLDAARARLAQVADRLDRLGVAHAGVREIVEGYAGELADLQERARRLRAAESEAVEQAERYRRIVLDTEPTVGHPPWHAPPSRRVLRDQHAVWALRLWQEAVDDHDRVLRDWRDLVEDREALDRYTADRLDAVPELEALRPRNPATGPRAAVTVAATLWAGPDAVVHAEDLAALGDATEVRAVWDRLSDVQRQWLVSSESAVTGNLDGIPIAFRAQANRVNMQAEIARIDRVLAAVGTASIDNQLRPGESIVGLREARASYLLYLNSTQTVFDEAGRATKVTGVPVVVFDPAAEAIATYRGPVDAHGDVPDWIANVAIHVPGTGTNLASFASNDERALSLYRRAHELVEDQDAGPTAVFVWGGGRFPQNVQAVYSGFSRNLGPRLREFAAAVDTHPGRSTLTVTGHSYGGTVVGMAEAAGLRADRILYVSGAGLGNENTQVADFPNTADVPHYALMARNDGIVGYVQGADVWELGHGASPLRDPDVVRLETGFLDDIARVPGQDVESLGPAASHSGVCTVGSTAFENIVQTIVGGSGGDLRPGCRGRPTRPDRARAGAPADRPHDRRHRPGRLRPARHGGAVVHGAAVVRAAGSRRARWSVTLLAAMWGGVLMTGCARSAASEVDVQDRAEEVTALLLSAAEGVPRYQDDIIEADDRKMDTTFDNPWRYWEVHANIELAEDATTSPPQVRDEMMRLLRADGWTEDDRNDAITGGAETFRKQDLGGVWTVLLGAWESPPPKPQQVYFWVVSPSVDH